MNTKLTLSIEKSLIQKMKQYAKGKNTSLSRLVENYFKFLSMNKKNKSRNEELTPITKKLIGCAKPLRKTNKSDKEILIDALMEKYG